MKTMKTIFKFILTALAVVTFFSCDIPVGLGAKLDLLGPVVTITYPPNRKIVTEEFDLKGTVSDATGVDRMEIKAVQNNIDFPRQWRYVSGVWEVSDDSGATWSPLAGAEWNGTEKSASWKIHINMVVIGSTPNEGQYTFFVQAWDKAGFSDDNSYKTVILIIDTDPPAVDISYPFLYRARDYNGTSPLDINPFKSYVAIADNGAEKTNPSYLGKFVTQGFDLKWQADDPSDIYAVEISFYKVTSGVAATGSDYLYRFTKNNLETIPDNMNPGDFIKPNGTVKVDLESTAPLTTTNLKGDETYERKTSITSKTTILVEMVAKDAAGNTTQDKQLGYFIYWPAANKPWIAFADGMKPVKGPPSSYGQSIAANGTLENSVFTVFPSKYIKATAYQPHGVSKVTFAIYQCNTENGTLNDKPLTDLKLMGEVTGDGLKPNTPNSLGQYQTIFPLEFDVPIHAGYYLLIAKAFGTNNDVQSDEYQMLFRVNDITFPQFIEGPFPDASVPLFMDIKNNKITIKGKVDDATAVKNLCMVWINPESEGYKAMSQLSYFRDASYRGWTKALTLVQGGASDLENIGEAWDNQHRNRLWKLNFTADTTVGANGIDPKTNRHIYNYSREIDLTNDLNIGTAAGQLPLKSQIFLFRLENTAGRTTIITYAPQGDTSLPEIKITNVTITATASQVPNPDGPGNITAPTKNMTCTPGEFVLIEKFNGNETITINGTWTEDSIEILDMTTYFRNNFAINVNSTTLFDQHPKSGSAIGNPANTGNFTLTQGTGTNKKTGTWRMTIPVTYNAIASAGQISTSSLKDTLVIDVKTSDIGGNVAQIGNSWLIKSDTLRLMRISSDKDDGVYKAGEEIDLFLEFSKPVKLSYPGSIPANNDIWLELSTGGKAKFKSGQTEQNSRQYFTYTVRAGENTTTGSHLNVTGLFVGTYNSSNNTYTGTSYDTGTAYTGNYLFAWSRGSNTEFEEVRLTMTANKTGIGEEGIGQIPGQLNTKGYFVRTLPTATSTSNSDYQYTLYAAKDIKIDTAYPRVVAVDGAYVKALTNPGWYNSGDIYFSITFDEPVIVGSGTKLPKFPVTLRSGSTDTTSATNADVRVNGNTVTFKYTIKTTDSSYGGMIYLSSSAGPGENTITDLAGNAYPNDTSAGTIRALSEANRTIKDKAGNGIYVETRTPPTPTVRILTSNTTAIDTNVLTNNVSGTPHYGNSTQTNKTLSNVYQKDLWLAIEGKTATDGGGAFQYKALEYSVDNGVNWIRAKNTANTPVALDTARTGTYNIRARQIDEAGNVTAESDWSPTVSFNWDSGALIERISSSTANGEYTNVTGRNTIALTVYFRKPLFISGTPTLTLNVKNNNNQNVTVTTIDSSTPLTSARSSVTFNYVVSKPTVSATGDNIPTGAVGYPYLDITGISGFTARDGTSASNGVDVSNFVTLPDGTPKLDSNKKFTVATGDLTLDSLTFAADSGAQTDSSFHGIKEDDGSYWTTLEIKFNRNINKGTGTITITQSDTNYRLPAVMTEAQYNRIKSLISSNNNGTVAANINIDTYYTKGTNGYINGTGSDTSTKYVLNYNYDPDSTVTSNGTGGFTGNTSIPAVFYTEFRKAEVVSYNINAAAVTVDGSTLKVRLAGSSALQVPGATYTVNLGTSSIVSDSLGNSIKDFSANGNYSATLRGVAKPFIRIRKTQDTITAGTGSATAPRLAASQPMLAYARMDCRTPGSTIYYTNNEGRTTLTGANPVTARDTTSTSNNNWAPGYRPPGWTGQADPTPPNTSGGNTGNNDDSMLASHPSAPTATTTTTNFQYSSTAKQIELGKNANGTTPHIGNVQGYQWWAAARAYVGTTNSLVSEEVAFRTVISYSLRGSNGAATVDTGNAMAINITGQADSRTILGSGEQVWIRGGDAILSSSIPGFPFTWSDDWTALSGKRAGIRLMTLVDKNNTDAGAAITCGRTANTNDTAGNALTLNNSLWRLVTWEMTTPAYIDFIRGIDTGSTADIAWQYGPLNWAYQSDGWTSAKESYKVYVGKHRWCDTGYNHNFAGGTRGKINFSGVINARPTKSTNEGYSGTANK